MERKAESPDLKQSKIPEPMKCYDVISQDKRVLIYPNGYGLVRFKTRILVKRKDFTGPIHYFGLSDSVPPDVAMPPVSVMCKANLLDAGTRAFMNFRLLSPGHLGFAAHAIELASQSTERMRIVQLQIEPSSRIGQEFMYAWEWGFPKLFSTGAGSEESSSFRCMTPVRQLSTEVRFLHPGVDQRVEFEKEPALRIVMSDPCQEAVFEAEGFDTLDYISYRWTLGRAKPKDQYLVTWTCA